MANKDIEITGFRELNQKLKKLTGAVKKEAMLEIFEKGAIPVVAAAKAEAPISENDHWQGGKRKKEKISSGNLKRSIGTIRGQRGFAADNPVLYVGAKAKNTANDGWYAGIVHGGHNIYKAGSSRKHVKNSSKVNKSGAKTFVAANPFMDRAFKKTKRVSLKKIEFDITKYIDVQIKKVSDV